MNTAIDAIVSGNLCLDLLPEVEHLPLSALSSPGRLFEVGPLRIATGGSVSNTGLTLHKLGIHVHLMAVVGDDLIGRMIIDYIEQRAPLLSGSIRIQPGQASPYTIVLSPEKADRIFLHCTGADTTFGSEIVREEFAAGARLFHLGYPPLLPRLYANAGEELERVMREAKGMNAITSLDMSLPDALSSSGHANWQIILEKTLPFTDIFIPSIEEILFALRRADYDKWGRGILQHINGRYLGELADELIDMGAAIAGFKLGAMGLFIRTAAHQRLERLAALGIHTKQWADVRYYQPAFQVGVVGTTGAGDAAYAGFLAALLHGLAPGEAARVASAVGACCVEAPDATSSILSWDATLARLNSDWQLANIRLPD
jgi:sugar/nucleoside kinase (ribokinase family)